MWVAVAGKSEDGEEERESVMPGQQLDLCGLEGGQYVVGR